MPPGLAVRPQAGARERVNAHTIALLETARIGRCESCGAPEQLLLTLLDENDGAEIDVCGGCQLP